MIPARSLAAGAALAVGSASWLSAQQFRLTLDSRFQSVAFRGLRLDSVPSSETVTSSSGGRATNEGFAVRCLPGEFYCYYFRPGAVLRSNPWVTTARGAVWDLGLPGLSLHTQGQVAAKLRSGATWPGSQPAFRLLEGYARYTTSRLDLRAGRQYVVAGRFGLRGLDGAGVTLQLPDAGLALSGYAGWGLARGGSLPITSEVVNPLEEFRPRQRELVSGVQVGLRSGPIRLRTAYHREYDPGPRYLVGERLGADLWAQLPGRFDLSAGADYDLAMGWWGNAEIVFGFSPRRWLDAGLGVRRYRPYFELWSIWGAFTPAPYDAAFGHLVLRLPERLILNTRGEVYRYLPTGAATPLVVETMDRGWRWSAGASYSPASSWLLDLGYQLELGPGAGSGAAQGAVLYRPSNRLKLALDASILERPLELRFNQSSLRALGAQFEFRPSATFSLGVQLQGYRETRDRPDAASLTWDHLRLATWLTVLLASDARSAGLPPAVRRMPSGGVIR